MLFLRDDDCSQFLADIVLLSSAIKSAGNCSVPITLIVLGSYFVEEPSSATPLSKAQTRKARLHKEESIASSLRQKFSALFTIPKRDKGAAKLSKPGESRTVFVSVVSRMILAPLGDVSTFPEIIGVFNLLDNWLNLRSHDTLPGAMVHQNSEYCRRPSLYSNRGACDRLSTCYYARTNDFGRWQFF